MAQQQWRYTYSIIENSELAKRLRHVLNWRGSEGWELVNLSPMVKPFLGESQGGSVIVTFRKPGLGEFDPNIADPPVI